MPKRAATKSLDDRLARAPAVRAILARVRKLTARDRALLRETLLMGVSRRVRPATRQQS